MTTPAHILVVDDHEDIRAAVSGFLTREGCVVGNAADAKEMDQYLTLHSVDLMVLDVMLPGEDGRSICKRVQHQNAIPIIIVSALNADEHIIDGLNLGADDYLTKPFNPKELLARINALLRRSAKGAVLRKNLGGQRVRFGGIVLDVDARTLTKADASTEVLTSAELKLLLIFLERARTVIDRDALLMLATGRKAGPLDRTVDNQISRLRKKIEPDSMHPRIISTVRNGGYSLTCDVEVDP